MPMMEVVYVRVEPLEEERKRAFAREAFEIAQEVLGTKRPQFRLTYTHVEPENSHAYLLEQAEASE